MSVQHTELPWSVEGATDIVSKGGRRWICKPYKDNAPSADDDAFHVDAANAEFIVLACNNHYQLLAAAEKALNFITNTECELGITLDSGDALRAAIAIAKAKGQQP